MVDVKWVESLKHLAAANARANRERLQRLSMEESIREFEVHCRLVHREFDDMPVRKTHPVGLIKYWKRA